MRFIVDEDFPQSACDLLAERGHDVRRVVDELLPSSADYLIARWAAQNDAVVATCNAAHFRRILKRPLYRRAGLLCLPQLRARERLAELIEHVELAGRQAEKGEARVWFEIRESTVFIDR